jgi:alkanesulfonate monooxygenase SsuD/methylene tetrahydromethanopterin reductase-like flavin-dependent oxidoreductase (luciferase family)
VTVLGFVFRPQFALDRLRAAAEAADRSPLAELWLWEDCFEHGGVATASAALAWTERLHVGVGVFPVPLRNPALVAMEIASLHAMFPGRVEIGLGHGVQEWMAQVGARAESPLTLLREYVTAVRALLAGDAVTSQGRYVQLRDVRLGWPPPGSVAVHVAAVGPKTVAAAGAIGDGLILSGATTPEELRTARAGFSAMRPPDAPPGRVTVYVEASGDAAAAADRARSFAAAGADADAVILEPAAADDPVDYVQFLAEEVHPLLGQEHADTSYTRG